MRSQMKDPAADAKHFWDEVSRKSNPQLSISIFVPARLETASTRIECIRADFVNDLGQLFHRILCASGGLIVDNGDRFVMFGFQASANWSGLITSPQGISTLSAGLPIGDGDIVPAFGKCSVHAQ